MGYYVGAESGGLRTPGYVLAEMRTIDNQLNSMVQSVADSNVSAKFKADFGLFINEWRKFFDDHREGAAAWLSRGTTPIYNKVIEYRTIAKLWRDKFRSLGGFLVTPDLPEKRRFNLWPWIIGGGIVYGLSWYLFSSRKARE